MKASITILRQHLTATTQNKDELKKKITSLLHFSLRSGVAVVGQNRIMAGNPGALGLVLVNSNASENTLKSLVKLAGENRVSLLDKNFDLGDETGKAGVKVMGLKRSELQVQIGQLVKQYMRESENER